MLLAVAVFIVRLAVTITAGVIAGLGFDRVVTNRLLDR